MAKLIVFVAVFVFMINEFHSSFAQNDCEKDFCFECPKGMKCICQGGYAYAVNPKGAKSNYVDSAKACKALGMDLAVIRGTFAKQAIKSLFKGTWPNLRLGYKRTDASKKTLVLPDKSKLDFTKRVTGVFQECFKCDDPGCVVMVQNGWKTTDCKEKYLPLCEQPVQCSFAQNPEKFKEKISGTITGIISKVMMGGRISLDDLGSPGRGKKLGLF